MFKLIRATHLRVLILVLAAGAVAGCRTAKPADMVDYTGDVPVWIFIPTTPLGPGLSGFPAQIASPPRDYTTNHIEVTLSGEVIAEGTFHLLQGSTVLQAIASAGGFTHFALARRPRIIRRSGSVVTLYRHERFITGGKYRQVWCDSSKEGNSTADYPLEDGDRIHVPRANF